MGGIKNALPAIGGTILGGLIGGPAGAGIGAGIGGGISSGLMQGSSQKEAQRNQEAYNWASAQQQRQWALADQAKAQRWQQEQIDQSRFLALSDAERARQLYDRYRYGDIQAYERAGQAQIDAARRAGAQAIPNILNQAAALGIQPSSGQLNKLLKQQQFSTLGQVGQIRGATAQAQATPFYAPPSQMYGQWQYPFTNLPVYQTQIPGMQFQPVTSGLQGGVDAAQQLAGMYTAMQMLNPGGGGQQSWWSNPINATSGMFGASGGPPPSMYGGANWLVSPF